MSFFHSPRIVTDGLVLYLDAANSKSYPGSGTDWYDLVNTSATGSISGPNYSANNLGVLSFSSASVDYVDPDTNLFTDSFLQNDWTISFWVNWSSLNTLDFIPFPDRTLLQHGSAATRQGLHTTQRNTRILFGLYGDDLEGTTLLQTNTWYNVVYSLKNSVTRNRKIYLNGVIDAEDTPGGAYVGSGGNARIGGAVLAFGGSYTAHSFDGDMGVCIAYNRPLTEQEVLQNYNALRGRFGI